jgi:lysine/ornithine N-monooxygenase
MLDSEIVIYRLHKWYNKIAVKDEYKDQFVDITPGDGWLDKDDSKFINKDFDESEGMSMVPKKSLYDNSKAYAKVMNSKTLKALYDAVYQTIDEANQL